MVFTQQWPTDSHASYKASTCNRFPPPVAFTFPESQLLTIHTVGTRSKFHLHLFLFAEAYISNLPPLYKFISMLSSRFIFPKNTNLCRHFVKHLSSYPTKCFLIPTYSLRNSTCLSRSLISRINTSQSFSPCLSVRSASMASQSTTSVHGFTVKDAKGNDVDLSMYKGKVLLIVNVASQWYSS